jgi:peptidoglycan-N-acetylglucosamine deacetylase
MHRALVIVFILAFSISRGFCELSSDSNTQPLLPPEISSELELFSDFEPELSQILIEGRFVALTFDDGPHPTLTPKLLEHLAARGATATFFIIGERAQKYPHIVRLIHDAGHEIGNHSWNHRRMTLLSMAEVKRDLLRTQQIIQQITGVSPKLFRPPYGAYNPMVRRACEDLGMQMALWSLDTKDWKNRDPRKISNKIIQDIERDRVILFHDIHASTVEATPDILDFLISQNYEFVNLSLMGQAIPLENLLQRSAVRRSVAQ